MRRFKNCRDFSNIMSKFLLFRCLCMYVGCGIKPSLDCTIGSLIFSLALYPFNEILQNAGMFLFIRVYLMYAICFAIPE